MSCCGGNCGCGSDCKCGNGCGGCKKMYPDLEGSSSSSSSSSSATETFIVGVAPKINAYYTEMGNVVGGGTENGGTCKCGDNCTCNPCNCDK